jgi:hypothetical protein
VFERDGHGGINPDSLPNLVVSDGRLDWAPPDHDQRQETPDASSASIAPEPELAPLTAAEQRLIAANRAKIEELQTLPQGAEDLELADLLHMVTRRSGGEIGLSVAGLALQVAGIVPITVWEGVMTTAGAAGLALRHKHQGRAHELVRAGSDGADELWKAHPEFVMGTIVNILHGIAQAASVDDTDLENKLDAFYPHWSTTDFEFDLRHYLR